MAKLGRKRMKDLKGRVKYVLCDFSKPGWSRKIKGPFEAVVSSIAIHNVRSPDVIRVNLRRDFFIGETRRLFPEFRSYDSVAEGSDKMVEGSRV
jgi:hypothetical protein